MRRERRPEAVGPFVGMIPVPLLVVAVSALWGSNFVAVKAALAYSPPLLLASLRAGLGGIAVGVVAHLLGARVPRSRRHLVTIAWIALHMTTLSAAFLVTGVQHMSAGMASIVLNTMPLFMVLLARPMLGEHPTPRALSGLVTGFAGVVVISVPAVRGGVQPLGVMFILLAALTWASGSILYKRADLQGVHPAMVIAVQLVLSAVGLAVASLILGGFDGADLDPGFIFPLAWTSLGGLALAFLAWGEVLRRASALVASAGTFLVPVFGVLFGAALQQEAVGWPKIVGGVLVLCGVAMATLPAPRRVRARSSL